MISDESLLEQARQHIQQHLDTQEWWRANEVRENSYVYEGDPQWSEEEARKQLADGMPTVTINKLAPVVDAVAGFEVQNRSEVTYQPRLNNDDNQAGTVNVMDNTVKYIQQDSFAAFEKSQAFKDMLVTGVGCTNTSIDYLENPDGETEVERISPYFCGWDVAARRKNLVDANHAWIAKPTTQEVIAAEIEEKTGEKLDATGTALAGLNDSRFLDFLDVLQGQTSLGIIYEYQWREKESFWRLRNAFKELPPHPLLAAYLQAAMDEYKFDINDPVFSLFKGQYIEFKRKIEAMGLDMKMFRPLPQQRWKYYRAEIAGNRVLEKKELFSQKGFSIKFMTGKYSEQHQCWYGLLRAAKHAQRLYNKAISDLQGYLNSTPKGGVHIEVGAVENIKAFIKTFAKSKQVTVYKDGALTSGKMLPKQPSPMPPGLAEMVAEMSNAILEVMGVNRDFMGIMDSKEMTASLNRQMVRQGLMVLAPYFDALKYYTIEQGRLFLDCVRIMAENAPGRLVRNVVGDGSAKYIPLTTDAIAHEYDIIVKDVPQSADEKMEIFQTLMGLAESLAPRGVDITPLAIQFAPLEKEEKDKVIEMMKPQPPPPPDPNSVALIQSEIKKRVADAEEASANTILKKLQAIELQTNLKHVDEKTEAEIEEVLSKITLNLSKAGEARNKDVYDGNQPNA